MLSNEDSARFRFECLELAARHGATSTKGIVPLASEFYAFVSRTLPDPAVTFTANVDADQIHRALLDLKKRHGGNGLGLA